MIVINRGIPVGNLKLVEYLDNRPVKIHAESDNSNFSRQRMQDKRLDILLYNSQLDLRLLENTPIELD
jgi:hypothetical protein